MLDPFLNWKAHQQISHFVDSLSWSHSQNDDYSSCPIGESEFFAFLAVQTAAESLFLLEITLQLLIHATVILGRTGASQSNVTPGEVKQTA